jgi:hypothetical protein
MISRKTLPLALTKSAGLSLVVGTPLEALKVNVEFDKTFNFKAVRTWAWSPDGPGQVMMARSTYDNKAAMKQRAEPPIVEEVTGGLTKRGLQQATAAPDVTVTYYLLLTTNMSAQTMGQFLPATTAWGLPPFHQATQSLKMMNHGSLVLDLSAKGTVVWRGVAQAEIKMDTSDEKREALLREGVRDLLERYPPKQ